MESNATAHQITRLRWAANMLGLWALCGKPACRRAQSCRRDPDACLARYAPFVPGDVRSAVALMAEGKRYGLSYAEVRADAGAEIAAFEGWRARIGHAVRPAIPDEGRL
jgi:hypothetical protein